MEITKDILYVGVNDHLVDLFEGQYDVPNGMAYNSYLICDDKVAVMDSVDAHFTDEWITKIAAALGERTPDYLVVQHMEPDHSGSVAAFAQAYPGTTIVASAQAFNMMKAYFGTDYADRRVVVKEGDTLPLGTHTLHFVTAPMVHWPEVIMTYDDADKVLFSADAFGKFGALDVEEPWLPEARRYFIGIVGKYGVQVPPRDRGGARRLQQHLGPHCRGCQRPGRGPAREGRGDGCHGPGPLRYGRGRRAGIPLQQAGTGHAYLQRRCIPLHEGVHPSPDRAQLPEPHGGLY